MTTPQSHIDWKKYVFFFFYACACFADFGSSIFLGPCASFVHVEVQNVCLFVPVQAWPSLTSLLWWLSHYLTTIYYNIMFVSLADGHTNMCNAFEKRNKVKCYVYRYFFVVAVLVLELQWVAECMYIYIYVCGWYVPASLCMAEKCMVSLPRLLENSLKISPLENLTHSHP